MSSADPRQAQRFRFVRCSYDPASGEASLVYALDDGPELVERIVFPYAPWPPEASRQAAFGNALQILHLLAGVSYYKTAVPSNIEVEQAGLDDDLSADTADAGRGVHTHQADLRIRRKRQVRPGRP